MNKESLFAAALEKSTPAGRRAFLDEACAGDAALRQQVERLLAADEHAQGILERGPAAALAPRPLEPPLAADLLFAGRFKLRQKLGEGGMGEVWVADQTEPVQRRVALKVVRPGLDSARLLARFSQERQALALMDHPNIAQVLDAGTTDSGRPYFVMEFIKGASITRYCDDARFSPRDRLGLFLLVCEAVQHAHQKGIIHRDIKASNILVALYDSKPVPKVIDFGVAKASGPRLTEPTVYTEVGALVGTPEYMSPEQAELNNLDIDTRSDIYSLGVVLYELLTGTTPLERERRAATSLWEWLQIIREEEPPWPSSRLSTTEELPAIAANRGLEPKKLPELVRGELDWIVMKCLEKDRDRRYQTASGLASDLKRYLADEPVVACPPSAGYRLRKFVRRNRVGMAAAAGVAFAVLAGLGASTWQAVRATRAEGLAAERLKAEVVAGERAKTNEARAVTEARRATAVADLLQQMLASANPEAAQKSGLTVRELLDAFAAELGNQLNDQPEVEATVRQVIGRAYWRLDLNIEAAPHLERAVALRRRTPGADPRRLAESLAAWGRVMLELKQIAPARAALEEALTLHRQAGSPRRVAIEAMVSLQMVARAEKRADEGVRLLAEARELARALPDGDDPGLACMLHVQALSLREARQPAEAERLAREAVAMHRRTRKPNDVELAHGLAEWGRCLKALERYDEAEAPVKEALAIFRVHFSDDHPSVASARDPLLEILRARGKAAEADRMPADRTREPLCPDRRDLMGWLSWAEARQAAGQWELAWQGYSEAARLVGPADRAAHARIGNGLLVVVHGLRVWLKREDALTATRAAVASLEQALADDPAGDGVPVLNEALASGLSLLGETLADLDRHPEAAGAYRKAVAQWRALRAADPERTSPLREQAFFTGRLSKSLLEAGRPEEATTAARDGLRLHKELLAGEAEDELYQERLWKAYGTLTVALENQGKLDEAVDGLRGALHTYPDTASVRRYVAGIMDARAFALAAGPDAEKRDPGRAIKLANEAIKVAPNFASSWNTLGAAHYRAGELDKAIVALQRCRELRTDPVEWSSPFFLAMAHWKRGDKDEARRWYVKGVKWMQRWAPGNASLIRFRAEAAQMLEVPEKGD